MKRTLEDELTLLRNMNSTSDLIASKQEEIDEATRDAYLYAIGLILMVVCVIVLHGWCFHTALNYGMQVKIIATNAIYHKVQIRSTCACVCKLVTRTCWAHTGLEA